MGIFLAIDLKSFYASVECIEKGYDPLDTNLVVADASRTEKTICLAVSPSLKKYGISGRARLFEVIQIINRENNKRLNQKIRGLYEKTAAYTAKPLRKRRKGHKKEEALLHRTRPAAPRRPYPG